MPVNDDKLDDNNIISLFKVMQKDVSEMRSMYAEMQQILVGWPRCQDLRNYCTSENSKKFDDIFKRLKPLEDNVAAYEANKENVVTPLALARAEGTLGDRARDGDDAILKELASLYKLFDTRLTAIESKFKLLSTPWDFIMNSNTAKTFILGGLLALFGIYWDRVNVYGWHIVYIVGGFTFVYIVLTWIASSKNRENAKKNVEKVFKL